jgi:hypothetical protein
MRNSDEADARGRYADGVGRTLYLEANENVGNQEPPDLLADVVDGYAAQRDAGQRRWLRLRRRAERRGGAHHCFPTICRGTLGDLLNSREKGLHPLLLLPRHFGREQGCLAIICSQAPHIRLQTARSGVLHSQSVTVGARCRAMPQSLPIRAGQRFVCCPLLSSLKQHARQARPPTIQHAAVKRTSAPDTYGSKAGRTAVTTRARSSSSACWRMRPTGPSWVR